MVALESLKESVSYGNIDVSELSHAIKAQYDRISANAQDIYENLAQVGKNF